MSLMRARRRSRQTGEINISPLIDMTFILLIFFMVTTTFVKDAELDIQRPGARSAAQADQRTVRVNIDSRGRVYVDARPVRSWMLQAKVRELLSKSRIKKILVVADRRVDTGNLVDAVDQCRMAGAEEVAVAVEHEI